MDPAHSPARDSKVRMMVRAFLIASALIAALFYLFNRFTGNSIG